MQGYGVAVDDIVVSTGEGSTSFEDDGDIADGWLASGSPTVSPSNDNDWIVGAVAGNPPSIGTIAKGSFAREPEILDFLAQPFGPYPFRAAGGVTDDISGVGYAGENQTRPHYSRDFFSSSASGDTVVVHELAHQWYGDSLSVDRWQHIWLNEGFATYAEWLWSEHEGLGTPGEIFDFFMAALPADHPFWSAVIGDPGPELLFDGAIYDRGALTLHALRLTIGDEKFFELLKAWAACQRGGTVTTDEFTALAERISGQRLDALFQEWLFTPAKPAAPAARAAVAAAIPPVLLAQGQRFGLDKNLFRR